MGTIIISLLLLALVSGIIAKLIINKKKGKSSCSCGRDCSVCGLCKRNLKDPFDFKSPCQENL